MHKAQGKAEHMGTNTGVCVVAMGECESSLLTAFICSVK